MSKKHKHKPRAPGIPASAAPNLEPPHDGTIRFEGEDGRVEHMKYWSGPEGAHTANAVASLEG